MPVRPRSPSSRRPLLPACTNAPIRQFPGWRSALKRRSRPGGPSGDWPSPREDGPDGGGAIQTWRETGSAEWRRRIGRRPRELMCPPASPLRLRSVRPRRRTPARGGSSHVSPTGGERRAVHPVRGVSGPRRSARGADEPGAHPTAVEAAAPFPSTGSSRRRRRVASSARAKAQASAATSSLSCLRTASGPSTTRPPGRSQGGSTSSRSRTPGATSPARPPPHGPAYGSPPACLPFPSLNADGRVALRFPGEAVGGHAASSARRQERTSRGSRADRPVPRPSRRARGRRPAGPSARARRSPRR